MCVCVCVCVCVRARVCVCKKYFALNGAQLLICNKTETKPNLSSEFAKFSYHVINRFISFSI